MKTILTTFVSLALTVLLFSQTEDDNVQFGFGVSLSSELSMYSVYGEIGVYQIITQPINMANFSMIIRKLFPFRAKHRLLYYLI